MISSYIKLALRNLIKYRANSWINVLGLAIGLACCLLILMYIENELSYDRFHHNKDRIYRVIRSVNRPDGFQGMWAVTGTPPGPLLEEEYPEVESAVRLFRTRIAAGTREDACYEDRFFFVDPEVFDVFSFRLAEGDPATALKEPYSVVMTREKAEKFFGNLDPIGRTLTIYGHSDLTVTGILEETPENSHLKFDFLASFETYLREVPSFRNHWDGPVWTYLLLRQGSSASSLEPRLREFIAKYRDPETASWLAYHLQPLTDIHFSDLHLGGESEPKAAKSNLYIFGTIGLLILLMGCINFINLSTVQYVERSKEAGVRKVLGARRGQLVRQYLSETYAFVTISVLLSIVLAELLMPVFNTLAGTDLRTEDFGDLFTVLGILFMIAFVGLVAGGYPALIFSSLSPVSLMQGHVGAGRRAVWLRRLLVIFQFAVSVVLIVCAVVIYAQLDFLRSKDVGFDAGQMVVVPMPTRYSAFDYEVFKRQVESSPNVIGVTACLDIPGGTDCRGISVRPEGMDRDMIVPSFFVDFDYPQLLGLEFVEGRGFSREHSSDADEAIILNESAVKAFGWGSGTGRTLTVFTGKPGDLSKSYQATVIGVVKDHHFRYLEYPLQPLAMRIYRPHSGYQLVRIARGDPSPAVDRLKAVWSELLPGQPIEFFFLDDYIDELYRGEERYFTMLGYACLLALTVACFGLFGLASFVTQQRAKEIGIRRVLGASIPGIALMFSKEFALLAAVSNLIAWPIAFYFMMGWLQGYRYRIDLDIRYFILAGIITLILVLVTVGYRSVRSASVNPVESLRYE